MTDVDLLGQPRPQAAARAYPGTYRQLGVTIDIRKRCQQ